MVHVPLASKHVSDAVLKDHPVCEIQTLLFEEHKCHDIDEARHNKDLTQGSDASDTASFTWVALGYYWISPIFIDDSLPEWPNLFQNTL